MRHIYLDPDGVAHVSKTLCGERFTHAEILGHKTHKEECEACKEVKKTMDTMSKSDEPVRTIEVPYEEPSNEPAWYDLMPKDDDE